MRNQLLNIMAVVDGEDSISCDLDTYLRLRRNSTGESGFADVVGGPIVRMIRATDHVDSSRPEVVLSVDRASMPHEGGQYGSEETKSQPHDEKRVRVLNR